MSALRRIAAVMWTYNRLEVALEGVRAVLDQTYPVQNVIVVDSASPDRSGARLAAEFGERVRVIGLVDNLGPGGALAEAFALIDGLDADGVWLVEDDSRPARDCLDRLVEVAGRMPSPSMIGPDGSNLRHGQWRPQPRLPLGARASVDFVYLDGALITADVVRRVAPPRRDYFLMMVDVEYPLRLRDAGVTMVQAGVDYEALRLGAASQDASWRTYYQTRNHLHLAMTRRSPALLAGFALRTAKQVAYAAATSRWIELRFRARGVIDALQGRMGRTVEPPDVLRTPGPPYPAAMPEGPAADLMTHTYSAAFDQALRSFLSTRGGASTWAVLHGNGPQSRMARFEASTLAELERHTGRLDGKRVLDFGCGTGTITPSLALRAKEVVAFDISPAAVDITRRRLREHGLDRVAVYQADSYRDLAAQLGAFDLVVTYAVFEHVPLSIDGLRREVIGQAFDALTPEGHLFISESPNRLYPRDIYCTGLWWLPWSRGGSRWAYRRAVAAGRHIDPEGRGPISLEERGAWGFTYWAVRRYLRDRQYEVVNSQPGHNRWVRYGAALSTKRRLYETALYYCVTEATRTPIVAFAPMISPLVLRRREVSDV